MISMVQWPLFLIFTINTLQITECFVFNMRILDYSFTCLGEGWDCNRFISTRVEFGDRPSCTADRKHAYDCICCNIQTCSPKTCSCLHGRFSPDTDSKLITNTTRGNESVATIWIAVHGKREFFNIPYQEAYFCTNLTLRTGRYQKTLKPESRGIDRRGNITLEFYVHPDYGTTIPSIEITHNNTAFLSIQGKPRQHTTCYGSTGDLTDASCSRDERIAPIDIFLGSKLQYTGCPDEPTHLNDSLKELCCKPKLGDCTGKATGYNFTSVYYMSCFGKTTCTKYQASRAPTSFLKCSNTGYKPYTTFMYMDYYCIKDSDIGRLPYVSVGTNSPGGAVYLQRSDYKNPGTTSRISCVACSIEATSHATINVLGLHVNFTSDANICNQNITIFEGNGPVHQIRCADNSVDNDYTIRSLYNSTANKIEVLYSSFSNIGDQFWLGFTASRAGRLTITCPVKKNSTICDPLQPTVAPVESPKAEPVSTLTIIIGVSGGVLAIILIIITVRYIKTRPSNKIHDQTTRRFDKNKTR